MAGLKYIKRDFVFYTNFDQEPVNPLKLMEGFVRETRERRYSSQSGGDEAAEEDRSGAFTKGRAVIATVP